MAKFKVYDEVYVPSRCLPSPDTRDFALTPARVQEYRQRKVRVNIQDKQNNDVWVSTKLLHGRNLGITVFRIGDLETEKETLDALAKSTLHYLRLFLRQDDVRLYEIRTAVEIQEIWRKDEHRTSHVIMIGHGSRDSIRLLDCSTPVTGTSLGQIFENASQTSVPKTFLSLSCLTGQAPFAQPFSSSEVCKEFIAPFQSVHSAAASLFAQSYFANHLLNGLGVRAAYRRAHEAVGTGVSFRHWRNGVWMKLSM